MSTFKACKRTRHTDAVTADQCAAKCTGSLASKCFTLFTDLDAGTESRYTYSTERLTWDDARDACRDAGMRLAVVRDAEEQAAVQQQLLPHGVSVASNFLSVVRDNRNLAMNNAWIGLHREDGGEWQWLAGDDDPDASTDARATRRAQHGWGIMQPNLRRGRSCGMMVRGVWNDRRCDVTSGYVCERGSVCDVVECDATLEANVSFSGQICDEEPEPGRAAVFNADPPRDDAAGQPQETDPLATVTADGVLRVLADMLTVRMASP